MNLYIKRKEYEDESYERLRYELSKYLASNEEIRSMVNNVLKFKNIHMHRATTIMNRLNPKLNNVMVSIHIRLTDFAKHLKKLWNMTYASDEYFERAMQYFHSKYEVRFVIMRDFNQVRFYLKTSIEFYKPMHFQYCRTSRSTH